MGETIDLQSLAVVARRVIQFSANNPYHGGNVLSGRMCDCMDYELEEEAPQIKEDVMLALPLQMVRSKRR